VNQGKIKEFVVKSLLTSPAYRQAGFTKGRNYPSLAKRGRGPMAWKI
jgi:hypothetical protein